MDDFLFINFEDERLQPITADNFQIILDAWFELHDLEKKPLIFFDNHNWSNFGCHNYGKIIRLYPVHEWLLT